MVVAPGVLTHREPVQRITDEQNAALNALHLRKWTWLTGCWWSTPADMSASPRARRSRTPAPPALIALYRHAQRGEVAPDTLVLCQLSLDAVELLRDRVAQFLRFAVQRPRDPLQRQAELPKRDDAVQALDVIDAVEPMPRRRPQRRAQQSDLVEVVQCAYGQSCRGGQFAYAPLARTPSTRSTLAPHVG